MKYYKIILGLILLMVCFTSGCVEETPTTSSVVESNTNTSSTQIEVVVPESIELFCDVSPRIIVVGEDEIRLDCFLEPSDASSDVIWTSSDENVAIVRQDEMDPTAAYVKGVGKGTVTISVFSSHNIEIIESLKFTVYDDDSDREVIANVKEELDKLIPNEVNKDIALPLTMNNNSVRLNWKSSNNELFSNQGVYSRAEDDSEVTISCEIKAGRITEKWEKTFTIVGIKNHGFKNISNRLITFVYLYDNKFVGFNTGDLKKIDVINYSFALIKNGKVDCTPLRNYKNVMKARSEGVRVVLSIGGWGADGWSDAVVDSSAREKFVESIINAIKTYHFDGVDLDWEYPTQTTSQGIGSNGAVDKDNYTELVKLLRQEMDKIDENLILSNAVSNSGAYRYYDVEELDKHLDYWHLMTYEMASSNKTSFDANLYKSKYATSGADTAVNNYINAGASVNKLVIGCAFYAYKYIIDASEYDVALYKNGMKLMPISPPVQVAYSDIAKLINPSVVQWDDEAKANWMFFENNDGTYTFITYDSYNGISAKGEYAKEKGMAGIMAWEYCEDYNSQLLSALYSSIR